MFAGPDVIGWRADNFLYLMPDATYSQVAKFCRETGEPLASPVHQLRLDLQTEGLSECEEGRTTTVVKVGGKARRVLKLKVEAIEALLGEELPLV